MQRVLREAMEAGAAGFATSFAMPHRGVDGKPVPSASPTAPSSRRCSRRWARSGAGSCRSRRATSARRPTCFDLQMKVGCRSRGRAAHVAHRLPPAGAGGEPVGWERGAEVWPQVTPPAHLHVHPRVAVPSRQRGVRALQNARSRSAPACMPIPWRARMKESLGAAAASLRWDTYTSGRARRTPRSSTQAGRRRCRARLRAARLLLDLALEEPELALRVRMIIANATKPAWPSCSSTSTAPSASPTPARTRPALRRPKRPTCSATGCATGVSSL